MLKDDAQREEILKRIRGLKGVVDAFFLRDEDRFNLLSVESEAEKKAFMGLGRCYNSGIREVLRLPIVVVAITNMEFDWGQQGQIVLKKDEEIVGEEVRDPARIRELEQRGDVWFLHKNFVVYKEKVDFPTDIVNKKCCFELPALSGEKSAPAFQ
ncbi:MAG: hypothetical protein ACPL7J_15100, partial [Desulfomonilaceae bacterium]